MVMPRIAPPVPIKPAEKPERAPPIIVCLNFGVITSLSLIINNRLSEIRKMPNTISRILLSKNLLKKPPRITKITDGIPI